MSSLGLNQLPTKETAAALTLPPGAGCNHKRTFELSQPAWPYILNGELLL